jgi:hypothetical protein
MPLLRRASKSHPVTPLLTSMQPLSLTYYIEDDCPNFLQQHQRRKKSAKRRDFFRGLLSAQIFSRLPP